MKLEVVVAVLAVGLAAVLLGAVTSSAATPATLTVNSTGDSDARDGVLTLREAMKLADGDDGLYVADLDSGECAQVSNSTYGPPCSSSDTLGLSSADTIVFDPSVFPSGAPATVSLGSSLPRMDDSGDSVDGSGAGVIVDGVTRTVPCFITDHGPHTVKGVEIYNCFIGVWIPSENARQVTVEGNVISGNVWGIVEEGLDNTITGNFIGTDRSGTYAIPNLSIGIDASAVQAGGSTIIDNVISGNGSEGVRLHWRSSVVVQGNRIGVDASGQNPIPNGSHGMNVFNGSAFIPGMIGGTAAGDGNVIAYNLGDGVRVGSSDATGVTIRGNSIYSNGGKGIENISGGNLELPPPVVMALSPVRGTACAGCVIDVYSDDEDEGRTYHGSTTADGSGDWSFAGAVGGPNVTATATDAAGNTSEFSAPVSPVNIDIRASDGRNVALRGDGLIPVTVLSSPGFDAPGEVDRGSLTFGRTGGEESLAFCQRPASDVNRDGLADLTCLFRGRVAGLACGDTEGLLRGLRTDGVWIAGDDSVRVLGC